jgi:arylsulfatase A-like enzyme
MTGGAVSRGADGPSLILVIADTTRADVFADADPGSRFHETMDQCGRVYQRAITPAPWTAPAHASIFSGLAPGEHGVWRPNLFDAGGRPRANVVHGELAARWLPVKLQELGYRTFAISANPWVAPFFGFDAGFERFESLKDWSPRWASRSASARAARRLPDPVASRLRRRRLKKRLADLGPDAGARRSLETTYEWLAASDRPYFAFLNFMEPHWPYRPPADFDGYSDPERRLAVDLLSRLGQFKRFSIQAFLQRTVLPDRDRQMLRKLYEGEVRYLQRLLSEFVERLDAAGALRDTVVVVTSDHGEQLGEHGLYGHGSSLHEELLHVPLWTLGPPDLVGRGVETRRVSTQGLYRAFLDWARGEQAILSNGPVLAEAEGMWYQPVVQRMGLDAPMEAKLKATSWAMYDGDRKYIRDEAGGEALYDLAEDPSESTDKADPHHLDSMRALMAGALSERRPPMRNGSAGAPVAMDPDVEGQLRSLGYL